MTKMQRTNYWNPKVKYVTKNSAQDYMKSSKAKAVSSAVRKVAADCSCNCFGGCSGGGSCTSCTSCS